MAQVLQIKRRVTGPGDPDELAPGELAYNSTGNTLVVGDNAGDPQQLVSASRQLELTGDQEIAPGSKKTISYADLVLTGGDVNFVLQTDGLGHLTWAAPSATPPASDAEITAGVLNSAFATPLNLMALTGSQVTTLQTIAKTIVPAINELKAATDLSSAGSVFVGSFNAVAGTIAWTAASGQTGNTLPAAASGNAGWYLICDNPGNTPPTGFPARTYSAGDWVISDGSAWTALAYGSAAVTAAAVSVTPAVLGQTNVQGALQSLNTANTTQDTAITGKVGEAPTDGFTYGRATSLWKRAIAATGDTMTGALILAMAAPAMLLNKAASGASAMLTGLTNNQPRWSVALGDSTVESGANAGSDFSLSRYDDAGTLIDAPFTVNRQTGTLNFTHTPTILNVPIGGGLATVAVTTPQLTGDGTPGSPITFMGVTTDASFTGSGTPTSSLTLAVVDGGTY